MVALDGIQIGARPVPALAADGAIFDTGTSLITTSAADAGAINGVCACPLTTLAQKSDRNLRLTTCLT